MAELKRIQVSYKWESSDSFACLVNLNFDENGKYTGFSNTLEWFPKSLCVLEKIEAEPFPEYFITVPVWLLDKKKIKHD